MRAPQSIQLKQQKVLASEVADHLHTGQKQVDPKLYQIYLVYKILTGA